MDLGEPPDKISGEGSGLGSLNSNFDSLEGTQESIGDDFGRGRRNGPEDFSVVGEGLVSDDLLGQVLEQLVETELSESLETVPDEGGAESEGEFGDSSGGLDVLEAAQDGFVLVRVDLFSAFNYIDRGDAGMGKTASHGSAHHTF